MPSQTTHLGFRAKTAKNAAMSPSPVHEQSQRASSSGTSLDSPTWQSQGYERISHHAPLRAVWNQHRSSLRTTKIPSDYVPETSWPPLGGN
ncbi:hypothetical protein E4U42_003255 [Claviceps africana]|uniref:Uncharacterized protein n=1 Tax=Claviceps africana TaxID=83212 RepID=A0A8K0J7I9_9HYPO|nr:hypothetical protein E4U42_003255 [Claviceps africana]